MKLSRWLMRGLDLYKGQGQDLKGKIYTKIAANDSKFIYRKLGKRNISN